MTVLAPPRIRFHPPVEARSTWARLRTRFTTASSAPSDSVLDQTEQSTDDGFVLSSCAAVSGAAPVQLASQSAAAAARPLGASTSSTATTLPAGILQQLDDEDGLDSDFIIVDNTSPPEYWTVTSTAHAGGSEKNHKNNTPSEQGGNRSTSFVGGSVMYGDKLSHTPDGNWFTDRVYPLLMYFFNPHYATQEQEDAYQKERWYTNKNTAIYSASFLVIIWLLSFAVPRPWSTWNEVLSYILGPILTLPILPVILFNFPRQRPLLFQCLLTACAWLWPFGNVIDMYLCGYYTAVPNCSNRDFQGNLFFASAVPTLALFALGQSRLFAASAVLLWLTIVMALLVPERTPYLRNTANIFLYHSFILFTHWRIELADRRMYTLRAELKVQFRAKQRAQIEEKKANDSKRRFTSYVFHELRVPLNTALLAVQNLEGSSSSRLEDSELEHATLRSSFKMMSQVLNDVLDFTRMERGGFSTVSRPFRFEAVMKSIFVPLQLDATARELKLETVLDDEIGRVGEFILGDELRLRQVINNLASNACKFTEPGGTVSIKTLLVYVTPETVRPSPTPQSSSPDVTSDPSTTAYTPNPLQSRASTDGSLASSKLVSQDCVIPVSSSESSSPTGQTKATTHSPHRLSAGRLRALEVKTSSPARDSQTSSKESPAQPTTPPPSKRRVAVIRIEIKDTGVGIQRRDLVDARLFSAYVQTEIGRTQGGKGTGLGLSLVRQIILLSGGRLGVQSRFGQGSCFWVELAFTIQSPTANTPLQHTTGGGAGMEKRYMPISLNSSRPATSDSINQHANSGKLTRPLLRILPDPLDVMSALSESGSDVILRNSVISERDSNSLGHEIVSLPTLPRTSTARSPSKMRGEGMRGEGGAGEGDQQLRILIVDDDSLTRRLMSRMMERLGCKTQMAENGAIALEMILRPMKVGEQDGGKHYDCIFLDNQMPIKSGLEVAKIVRSLGRDDLIVGVTANALLSDQQLYLSSGASFVLTKPVSEIDLRNMLREARARRDAGRLSSEEDSD